jgi:RNA 2',3'-cyclic 3'-phosphodiesterase
MRLFFALWLDAETKQQLAGVAAELRLAASSRLVPANNYHVTLAFIGEVPGSRLPDLLKIGAMQRGPPLKITFDAAEYWASSQVVVAAAQKVSPELLKLWEQLRKDLSLPEQPNQRAHVTLARKVVQAPVLQAMSPVSWSTSRFGLYRSETSGVQSAYTVVDTWSLLDET